MSDVQLVLSPRGNQINLNNKHDGYHCPLHGCSGLGVIGEHIGLYFSGNGHTFNCFPFCFYLQSGELWRSCWSTSHCTIHSSITAVTHMLLSTLEETNSSDCTVCSSTNLCKLLNVLSNRCIRCNGKHNFTAPHLRDHISRWITVCLLLFWAKSPNRSKRPRWEVIVHSFESTQTCLVPTLMFIS